ncbi:replication protein A1-like protein, partial [Trifolium medium]|nr:replication protein A1-like protein [Trifolium medium]
RLQEETFLHCHGFIQDSSDILLVELYAIFHGLTLAKNIDIDEFVCYSDSLQCINLIKDPSLPFHAPTVLIQDIKDLISHINVTICHTLREGNYCADFFAKLGASSNNDLLIHAPPPPKRHSGSSPERCVWNLFPSGITLEDQTLSLQSLVDHRFPSELTYEEMIKYKITIMAGSTVVLLVLL